MNVRRDVIETEKQNKNNMTAEPVAEAAVCQRLQRSA